MLNDEKLEMSMTLWSQCSAQMHPAAKYVYCKLSYSNIQGKA